MLCLTLVDEGARGADVRVSVTVLPGQALFSIGRDPACDWTLPDRTLAVSARHCEIVRAGAGVLLRDHSTNGTFVNGAAVRMPADHVLKDGDQFEVGPYTVAVRLNAPSARDSGFAATAALSGPLTAPMTMPLTSNERPLPKSPAAARTPAVDDTAPLPLRPPRGRDPAAAAASRLPPEEADLTRIRPAPMAGAAVPAPPAPSPPAGAAPPVTGGPPQPSPTSPLPVSSLPVSPAPVSPAPVSAAQPAAASAPAAVTGDDALHAQLAQALGLPTAALAGQDPSQLLARLGALARSSIEGLRQLLAAQAATQRAIGSRRPADWRAGSPLRLSASTDEALLALLGADPSATSATMAATVQSLIDHQARLAAAPRLALRRLGDDLAPDRLAAALPVADAAQQWAVYARLWQRLGLATADDAAWAEGFAAAGWLHVAAAYDRDDPMPPA